MTDTLQLLRDQAKRVMLGARYVIETDVFGNVKDVRVNRKPRVNVCAVIGPALVWGEMECEEAVLLEIGLRHGRPYHRAALGERGAQKEFGARSKYDTVDLSFLKNVWETLEGTLCYDAGGSRSKWGQEPFLGLPGLRRVAFNLNLSIILSVHLSFPYGFPLFTL